MAKSARKKKRTQSVQEALEQVRALLQKHRIVEDMVHKQDMPRHDLVESLVHKQNLAELQNKLDTLHPADVAYILEALPVEERLVIWDLVKAERDGEILLEVSDSVRETLIENMDAHELVAAAEQLDTDEIADLVPDLPQDVVDDVLHSMSVEEREQLRAAMSYPEDAVGALMDFDMVSVRDDVSLEVVLRYLRRMDELPDHTDQVFVVDREDVIKGVLPINRLIVTDPKGDVGPFYANASFTRSDGFETFAAYSQRVATDVYEVKDDFKAQGLSSNTFAVPFGDHGQSAKDPRVEKFLDGLLATQFRVTFIQADDNEPRYTRPSGPAYRYELFTATTTDALHAWLVRHDPATRDTQAGA